MFIWIDNGKFLYLDNTDDFRLIQKTIWNMDTDNDFENSNMLRIFIHILDDFLDLISSK